MGVLVEEPPELVLELGELLLVGVALVELQVVVEDVRGVHAEVLGDLGVVEERVEQVGLLEVGVQASVSHPGVEPHQRHEGVQREAQVEVRELVEEQGGGREHVELEVVGPPVPPLVPPLGGRHQSHDHVLDPRPEQGSNGGAVFGLRDVSVLVSILRVGVVGVLPLVLPPEIVRVAVVVGDLVVAESAGQGSRRPRNNKTHDL